MELKIISQLSRKKKKKHDKIVLLGKSKYIEILISKALIDSYISDKEIVLINNVLRD